MIIHADGTITGTIGGGLLEANVCQLAGQVFQTKVPLVHRFNLSASEIAQTNMICGGTGEVLLDYIQGSDPIHLEVYRELVNTLNKHETAWLITAMGPAHAAPLIVNKCLVGADGNITGSLACHAEILHEMISATTQPAVYDWEDRRLLVEPVQDKDWLYLFGAGHIAKQLAILADMADFKSVVVDDRCEYANRERFPYSDIVVLDSFEDLSATMQINPGSYLVIVTRGHMHDKTVLGQVLKTPSAYVGMIASQRKRRLIYDALQIEQGFETCDFASVHAPIGIEIMAETPEEIAISIIAELIKVRAERKQCSQKLWL